MTVEALQPGEGEPLQTVHHHVAPENLGLFIEIVNEVGRRGGISSVDTKYPDRDSRESGYRDLHITLTGKDVNLVDPARDLVETVRRIYGNPKDFVEKRSELIVNVVDVLRRATSPSSF
jgi:hypothetical protein